MTDSRALTRLRDTWAALGADDPLWAILSDPRKRGGRWTLDEFFAAGETEIAGIDAACVALSLPLSRAHAMDFGCGVGRLSRALASRYAQVTGVDIAPSMIANARRLNADVANLTFVENAAPALAFLADGSVDFIYSVIVLQHMPAALQLAYVDEFLRVLAPGGLAIFQVAAGYTRDTAGLIHRYVPNALLNPLRRWRDRSPAAFEMHVVEEADVAARIAARGGRLIRIEDDASAGAGFIGRRFVVAR